ALAVASAPELSERLEDTLGNNLESARRLRGRLHGIPCLRSSLGDVRSPNQLYLQTPEMEACVGFSAPFPSGSRSRLYRALGCRENARSDDIIDYLQQLR